jgi:hypothetical protein
VQLTPTEEQAALVRGWADRTAASTPAAVVAAAEEIRGSGTLTSGDGLGTALLAVVTVAARRHRLGLVVLADVVVRVAAELARRDPPAPQAAFGLGPDVDDTGLRLTAETGAGPGAWLVREAGSGILVAATPDGGLTLVESDVRDAGGGLTAPGPVRATGISVGPADAAVVRSVVRAGAAALLVGLVDGLLPPLADAASAIDVTADRWNGQGTKHRLADVALDRDAAWLHLFDAAEVPSDRARLHRCSALAALAALAAARTAAAEAAAAARSAGDPAALAAADEVRSTAAALEFVLGGPDRLLDLVASAVVGPVEAGR